ncbi:AfsR/SARP family transcriptional regulator [Catenulispora pinisilvae]|uniref:AfsR/SARP family transcriptional regulator n=1 Tax=Catenulispora pinisilvae TaxID=2705253 RepID=UPI0018913014|nr:tetratricopeptide repeat protein [Catenulispora pinisilvae]
MDPDIRLLGAPTVHHGGVPLRLDGQRRLCLLAVLVLNHGRTVSRTDLAEWAWPSSPPDTVDRQIANYVSGLRKILEPVEDRIQLVARRPGYTALIDPELLDTERFGVLLRRARDARDGQEHQIAGERLRQALGLWHGRPLEGLDTPYLRNRAAELERQRRDAAMLLAEIELETGRPADAAAVLRDVAAGRPDDEAVAATLIRALTQAGQTDEAAETATRADRSLRRQGRTPTPALRQAHSDALAGRVPSRPADPRHQLPADTGAVAGRVEELFEIARLAQRAEAGENPGVPVICTIEGMGGIGKTALAVHAAHLLADRFPDGQLFLEWHAHSAGVATRTAFDVLGSALAALGAPPQTVPNELDARAAKYRAMLAGTRTLIVLDNVDDENEIRPLIPAVAGCLVLITSRRRLKALDDVEPLGLDVLPVDDAVALFRATVGAGRTPADDEALTELVGLCGRLPLALRIAAALLRHRRSWQVEHVIRELREDSGDLRAFDDGQRNLASVFELSYRNLSDEQETALYRIAQVPGRDLDVFACACLLDADPRAARRLLAELVDRSLLTESVPGRFQMHDLMRAYGLSRAANADDEGIRDRESALDRLFDYYQHTAQLADGHLRTLPATYTSAVAHPPRHQPPIEDRESAQSWMTTEIENLIAAARYAATRPTGLHGIALPAAMATHLYSHGPWTHALELHGAAVALARRGPDAAALARALTDLGMARRLCGDYRGAADVHQEALLLYGKQEDERAQAFVLTELSRVWQLVGDQAAAGDTGTRALEISSRLDDLHGQARALTELGRVRRLAGDYAEAADTCTRAYRLYRRLDDARGLAEVLMQLGAIRHLTCDYDAATAAFTEALALWGELDSVLGRANALTSLGIVQRRTGDYNGATDNIIWALGTYRRLDSPLGQAGALTELGRLRRLTGDHRGAREALSKALDLYCLLAHPGGQATVKAELGNVRRLAGDHVGAVADTAEALRILRRFGSRGEEAWALNQHAAALSAAGRVEEALTVYSRALVLNREVGQPDDQATAFEGVGEILLQYGRVDEGGANLRRALNLFVRLGLQTEARRIRERYGAVVVEDEDPAEECLEYAIVVR